MTDLIVPWRSAEADALDAKAEAIEVALERMLMLNGIWDGDRASVHRTHCDMLELDAGNFRSKAENIRKERAAPTEDTRTEGKQDKHGAKRTSDR